jgi:hypothetical protein
VDRATRAIVWVQRAAIACACLGLGLAGFWGWPFISRWLSAASFPLPSLAAVGEMGQPAVVLVASAVVIGLLVLSDVGSTWARE